MRTRFIILLSLLAFSACQHSEYDTTRGVDKEMTLFTDQVSLPLGDIGPISPKQFLGEKGLPDMIKSLVEEDEQGYLVCQSKGSVYSNLVIMISMNLSDPSQPADVPLEDLAGEIESVASMLELFGLGVSPQTFTLQAGNPLTEGISVSGKLTLLEDEDAPIACEEFSKAPVEAAATGTQIFSMEIADAESATDFKLENTVLHLPASIMEKDPLGGFGVFTLDYQYKGYLCMQEDFPTALPFDFEDLNIPLGQFKVEEARICMEVSNEIPISLEISSVNILVKETDEEGVESYVPYEDVSVTPGLTIASGCSGNPVVSPLEIVIKAKEGTTIPDIPGLQLEFNLLAPTGEGDKRINLNQSVSFNHLRATVSGGITIPSL